MVAEPADDALKDQQQTNQQQSNQQQPNQQQQQPQPNHQPPAEGQGAGQPAPDQPDIAPNQPDQPADQPHDQPQPAQPAPETVGDVLPPDTLALMLDVPLQVTVRIDEVVLPLADVLALQPGSVIQLERAPGEPIDLLVNGRLVARGEIVVINDTFGFRVTEIVPPRPILGEAAAHEA